MKSINEALKLLKSYEAYLDKEYPNRYLADDHFINKLLAGLIELLTELKEFKTAKK